MLKLLRTTRVSHVSGKRGDNDGANQIGYS
jgi:hypothetical protein